MSSAGPIDLRCEISSLSDPVVGRVSDRRGRTVPFRGWVEFAAALTSLAEDQERQETNPSEEEQTNE